MPSRWQSRGARWGARGRVVTEAWLAALLALLHPAGSTHSSTRGLRPPEQLERPAGFPSSDKTRPDSPVLTLQGPCGRSPKRRGSLRFLPPLEMRPSSIGPKRAGPHLLLSLLSPSARQSRPSVDQRLLEKAGPQLPGRSPAGQPPRLTLTGSCPSRPGRPGRSRPSCAR